MTLTMDGRLDPLDSWVPEHCSLEMALSLIGPPSSMLVLREALYGTRRFEQFVRRLRMSETSVAGRLRHLTEIGLLERRQYRVAGARARDEYVLTQSGRALAPAVLALMQWGDTYAQDGAAPLELVDEKGERVEVMFQRADGSRIGMDELHVRATSTAD